jgi:hypothetical protein
LKRLASNLSQLVRDGPLCKNSIYAAIKAGDLPARKAGHLTLILHRDWEDYLMSLPDALASGAIRAATPDTTDENPPPRRASGGRPSPPDTDGSAAAPAVRRRQLLTTA